MKRKVPFGILFVLLLLAEVVWLVTSPRNSHHASGPLEHDAFVSQQDWNDSVRAAVTRHATDFHELILLAAEVTWKDNAPQVVRVPIDYAILNGTNTVIGLALHISAYAGQFSASDDTAKFLAGLAASVIAEAQSNSVHVAELQVDFDCPVARLEGYRHWLMAIKNACSPTHITITAMPSWLNEPVFEKLVRNSTHYILQACSPDRPKSFNASFTLCDTFETKLAVEEAARLGLAFRVALPTCGYLIAFDKQGKFLGQSADGASTNWPSGAQIREVRAEPLAMAGLVQTWTTNRPDMLRGVVWYRLPVTNDALNWRWPTMSAMLAVRSPVESFRAETRRTEPGLVQINLVNDGDLDISSQFAIEAQWTDARLVAGEGLLGFDATEENPGKVKFQSKAHRLPAGERQTVGWLRLSEQHVVQVEARKF